MLGFLDGEISLLDLLKLNRLMCFSLHNNGISSLNYIEENKLDIDVLFLSKLFSLAQPKAI